MGGDSQVMKGFLCWTAESTLDPQRELLKTFKQGCDVVRLISEKAHWRYCEGSCMETRLESWRLTGLALRVT